MDWLNDTFVFLLELYLLTLTTNLRDCWAPYTLISIRSLQIFCFLSVSETHCGASVRLTGFPGIPFPMCFGLGPQERFLHRIGRVEGNWQPLL